MGEYLDLRSPLSKNGITDYLRAHLPAKLAAHLEVNEGCVEAMLATGNDVYTTFGEMVALHALVRTGPFHYGPGHEYNATLDDLLQTSSCLYLGAWEDRGKPRHHVLIDGDVLDDLNQAAILRKTKRTLSKNGTWYHRKIRPDESAGNRGYQASCPNDTCEPFREIVAGFAWDAATN